MRIVSQPAEIAPDEAAARFTRATELLMRAAERRKAAQGFVAAAPVAVVPHHVVPVPFVSPAAFPRMAAGGRMMRHSAIQRGGHA